MPDAEEDRDDLRCCGELRALLQTSTAERIDAIERDILKRLRRILDSSTKRCKQTMKLVALAIFLKVPLGETRRKVYAGN